MKYSKTFDRVMLTIMAIFALGSWMFVFNSASKALFS